MVAGLFLLGACTGSSGDTATEQTEPTTTTTSASRSASPTVIPACRDVVEDAQKFAAEIGQLSSGKSTLTDVRKSADTLVATFNEAKADVGQEAQQSFDKAQQQVTKFKGVVSQKPVDTAAIRQSARDLAAALTDAIRVCSQGQ